MAKVLMLISDGMEEVEALMTRDILLRGGIGVTMASTNGKAEVVSQNGLVVKADQIGPAGYEMYDGIVLPGGGLGTRNLDTYEKMDELLAHFFMSKKLVAAICAAPMVLGHRGYLKGKSYTCFKDCNNGIEGMYVNYKRAVVCDNIITSPSVYFAADFGLAIIEYFKGTIEKLRVLDSVKSYYKID